MKYLKFIILIFVVIFSACKVATTDPGGDEAILTLVNSLNETLYYQIADGSINEDVVYSLPVNSDITLSWSINDDVFEVQNGEIVITYYIENGAVGIIHYTLQLGASATIYLGTVSHELVVKNNTHGDLLITYIDGYDAPFDVNSLSEIGFDYDIVIDTDIYMEFTGDHLFSAFDTITLSPNYVLEYNIYADGGAFQIHNNNPINDIIEVYISPDSSSVWGPNWLGYAITPGGWALWTVEEDLWDIKIVDEWGSSYEIFGQYVDFDATTIINYRAGNKTGNKTGNKAGNKAGNKIAMKSSESKKNEGESKYSKKIEFKRSSVSSN